MPLQILNQYEKDGFLITEYTRDGDSVSTTVKEPILSALPQPGLQPTIEQISEENLLETKYQTLLLEMML